MWILFRDRRKHLSQLLLSCFTLSQFVVLFGSCYRSFYRLFHKKEVKCVNGFYLKNLIVKRFLQETGYEPETWGHYESMKSISSLPLQTMLCYCIRNYRVMAEVLCLESINTHLIIVNDRKVGVPRKLGRVCSYRCLVDILNISFALWPQPQTSKKSALIKSTSNITWSITYKHQLDLEEFGFRHRKGHRDCLRAASCGAKGGLGGRVPPVVAKIDFPIRRNPNRKWSGGGGERSCEM